MCRALAILTLFGLLCWPAQAQNPSPPHAVIREIQVADDAPQEWPAGRWLPIPIQEYQALARAVTSPASALPRAWVSQAEYVATFDPVEHLLREGRWTAQVAGDVSEPELMSLEPLSLRLVDLAWDRKPAVWGTAPDGTTRVLVDAAPATLRAQWTLPGRRGLRRTEFDFRSVPATVSRLILKVPNGYVAASSAGDVQGPTAATEKEFSVWQVNLGSETACRISLELVQNLSRPERIVLYEQNSTYVVRQAELELGASFQVDVSGPPVEEFTFGVSKSLEVASVTQDGEVPLAWEQESPSAGRLKLIHVRPVPPWSAGTRSMQLRGFVSVSPRTSFALPQVTLQQATLSAGRINISVESPLILRHFEGTGVRQTQTIWMSEGAQHLVLDQYLPEASVTVNVGEPHYEVTGQVLTHVDLDPEKWTLTALVDWESSTGAAFSARCQLSPDWEITDVRMGSGMPESDLVDWTVSGDANSPPVLQVKFKDALAAGSPKRLTITAKRLPIAPATQVHVPTVVPLDCDEFKAVVVLTHRPETVPGIDSDTDFDVIDRESVPARWRESDLWKRLGTLDRTGTLILAADNPANAGVFSLAAANVPRPIEPDGTHAQQAVAATTETTSQAQASARLAKVALTSHLLYGGSSRSENSATFELLDWPADETFEFELADAASLVSVRVNGLTVLPAARDQAWVVPPLHNVKMRTVTVDYTAPMEHGFVRSRGQVPLPRVSCRVLGVDWQIRMPLGFELQGTPDLLHLQQAFPSLPWTVRFFGPLGRSADSQVFDPMSVAAWREALTGVASRERAATSASLETADTANARDYYGFSPILPMSVELCAWDAARLRSLAWVVLLACFFSGLVWRSVRLPAKPRVVVVWLALCVAGACCLPPALAESAGACLAGSVSALFFSRSWLSPFRFTWEKKCGPASTLSLQRISASVFWLALIARHVAGQESNANGRTALPKTATDSRPAQAVPEVFKVLVPVDPERKPMGQQGVVYLEVESLRRLNALARERSRRSDYVIASAAYEGNADADGFIVLKARFAVWVLNDAPLVSVSLPFSGGNLRGTDACRVDGHSHPVLRSPEGTGYVLELQRSDQSDHPRLHQIELVLDLAVTGVAGGGAVALGIPPTPSATLGMTFARPMEQISISSGNDRVVRRRENAVAAVPLRKCERLEMEWTTEPTRVSATTANTVVETVCLIEVQAALLRYHYRVTYEPGPAGLDRVTWRIPPGVVIHEQDVQAPDLLNVEIAPGSSDSQFQVLFSQPQTQRFSVQARWAMPTAASGDSLTVPLARLGDAPATEKRTELQKVGLLAAAGLRLEPRFGPEVQAIPQSPESFWHSWGETTAPSRVLAAYDVKVPTNLPLTIAPQTSEQTVRMDQSLRVFRNRIEWSLQAEVAIKQAPAFLYAIQMDPRLRIDSASVKQDDAERLTHWSTTAKGQLVLFLRDAATDVQTITVRGRMSFNRAAPIQIPDVRFDQATCERSTLSLYREAGLELAWEGGNSPQRLDETQTTATGPAQDVLEGRYALTPKGQLPELRVYSRRTPARVDSLTMLKHLEGNTWECTTHFRCRAVNGPLRRLKVLVPPSLAAARFSCDGPPEIQHRESRLAGGSLELTVSMIPEKVRELHLSVSATLQSDESSHWRLPRVAVVDAMDGERYLLVRVDNKPAAERSHGTPLGSDTAGSNGPRDWAAPATQWRPAEKDAAPLSAAAIPSWVKDAAGGLPATDDQTIFRSESSEWSLTRVETAPAERDDRVSLAETHLWLDDSDRCYGHTRLLCVQRISKQVILEIPADVRIRGLLLNGSAIAPELDNAGRMLVQLNRNVPVQSVDIYWWQTRGLGGPWLRPLPRQLPHASDPAEQRSVVTVFASTGERLLNGEIVSEEETIGCLLDRVEGLLDYVQVGATTQDGAWDKTAWFDLQRSMVPLRQRFALDPVDDSPHVAELRQRTSTAHEAVRSLVPLLGESSGLTSDSSTASAFDIPTLFARHAVPVSRSLLARRTSAAPIVLTGVWTVPAGIVFACATVLIFAVATVGFHKTWRLGVYGWLDRNGEWSLVVWGVMWWLCLRPSVVGVLIALATIVRPKRRVAVEEPATTT